MNFNHFFYYVSIKFHYYLIIISHSISFNMASNSSFQNLPKIRVLNEDDQSECEKCENDGMEGGGDWPKLKENIGQSFIGTTDNINKQNNEGSGLGAIVRRNLLLNRKLSLNTAPRDKLDPGGGEKLNRKFSLVESFVRSRAPVTAANNLGENNGNGLQHHLTPNQNNNQHRGSIQSNGSSKASKFKSRASELIIRVPARQLKKIAKTQGIGSLQRETQHFVGVTSINGLLRIYRSRGVFRLCWIFVTALSLSFLLWQICKLVNLYNSRPTVSQVSFLLPENGLPFPAVTICNHNPIRRAFVEQVNQTGQFSHHLLDYMMYSFMEPQYLLSVKSPSELELIEEEWKEFVHYSGKKFSVNGFFWNASTSCQQMLKFCSFGGREFDCCKYAKGILTDIGKCYQLYFGDTDQTWLRRQIQAGMNNGLQIIADAHTEESQIGSTSMIGTSMIGTGHAYADNFENGFRYFVHDQHAMPYLSTEGISVSPGQKVYSAISPTKYYLLSQDEWGNCTHRWPSNIEKIVTDGIVDPMALDENLPYSSLKCKTLCQAKHFYDLCGCSPFIYNIEEYYKVCSPYETLMCLNKTMVINETNPEVNGFANIVDMPSCTECKIECHRSVYHIYNSYAEGFSKSFNAWLHHRNPLWTSGHVRSNFVSINIFYRDMCYTEYKQVQSVSMTEILSDIGGNMGLFLGMSLISLTEFATYLCKITWLFISKARREHMLAKKRRDEDREKRLQATLEFAAHQKKFASGIGRMMSGVAVMPGMPMTGTAAVINGEGHGGRRNSMGGTFQRLRQIYTSTRRKATNGAKIEPVNVNAIVHNNNNDDIESGSTFPADELPIENVSSPRKSTRSSSVFANLFKTPSESRRGSATSIGSIYTNNNNHKYRHDFVESVIKSRLHGDAGRAARKSCSSSSSSISASSSNSSDMDDDDECGDKVVELKIDLDALKEGGENKKKRIAYLKPIYRRKSAYMMRKESKDDTKTRMAGVRRASTFAYPREKMVQPIGSRRSSLDPPQIPSTSSNSHQPISYRRFKLSSTSADGTENQNQQKSRRQSLVATISAFIGANSKQDLRKESDPEAPNLTRIAQKHSVILREKAKNDGGQLPVARSISQQ